MRKTNFYCMYELFDTSALADAKATCNYNADFADINLLNKVYESPKVPTTEKNFFLLNGMTELQDDFRIAFWSKKSDSNGRFEENPKITIDFTKNHSSYGFTLHFWEDYPLKIKVSFYSLNGTALHIGEYDVDSLDYHVKRQVNNYAKIEIEFLETKPFRYVKLARIDYGIKLNIGTDTDLQIKNAKLTVENNTLSDRVSVNKLTFSVIDEENDFNLGNENGLHTVMQIGQKFECYETVNDDSIFLGNYYLSKFSAQKNLCKIELQDIKGSVYSNEPCGLLIEDILKTCGITDYEIDTETYNSTLTGWLKTQTCRNALKEILFAVGSVVDTYQSDKIRIFKPNKLVKKRIERENKFSTSTSSNEYISDVLINSTSYIKESSISEISKKVYEQGDYTISFTSPVEVTEAINATLTEVHTNYIVIHVEEEKEVAIKGYKYTNDKLSAKASIRILEAGKSKKEKSFNTTLMGYKQALQRANEILEYYKMNLTIKVKYLCESEMLDWLQIQNENQGFAEYVARAEKADIDLTSGYISTITCRGYERIDRNYVYCGEIHAGEEVIL